MSDTDADAARGAGREPAAPGGGRTPPTGSWSPPQGEPGQPQPRGYWSPPQGEPGQPQPPGYWSPPQGEPGQPQPPYWSPPHGGQGQPPPPPPSWSPPQGEPGQPPPPGYWSPQPGAPGQPPPPPGAWSPYGAGPAAPVPPRRRNRLAVAAVVTIGAVLLTGLGVGWGYATSRIIHTVISGTQSPIHTVPQIGSNGSSGGSNGSSSSRLPAQSGQASQPVDVQAVAGKVSAAVVDVNTVIGSISGRSSQAAGTGMILTPDGEILTNNHVVDQSTSIKVTIPGRSNSYTATVVGVDPSADVALIKVQGVSGLPTVTLADSSTLTVGQQVVAIGNALGQGGAPSVTQGTITALDQSITASSDNGSSEQLDGLIQSDAPIQPGDSGGPLANAAGQVIGMITAGEAQGFRRSTSTIGYAIPSSAAVDVVNQIRSGNASSTVLIGPTGFLGVGVTNLTGAAASQIGLNVTSGVAVTGVQSGSPAEKIGIGANSVITAIDGSQIGSTNDLGAAIHTHKPGDKIRVTWVDRSGTHTATATLIAGPAA